MRPLEGKPIFYYQADGNAVGGFLETPEKKVIEAQASVSLPAVGGSSRAKSAAFRSDAILSVKQASVTVIGEETNEDGSVSITLEAVIDELNILEVVKAEQIVAHLKVECPVNDYRRISVEGSLFKGLVVDKKSVVPRMNPSLLHSRSGNGCCSLPNTWLTYHQVGREQAKAFTAAAGDMRWVKARYEWMRENTPADKLALASLVDAVDCDPSFAGGHIGHIVEIPDFGRIFLGEVLVSPISVRLTMIRVELGCKIKGGISAGSLTSNGSTIPPSKPT